MNLLFFDCETTGLPKDYKASYTDVDNWPRVISLAWILAKDDGEIIRKKHCLIRPDGWQMPTEKFWIDNGFSHEKSMAEGLDINDVIDEFRFDKHQADALVGHNLSFDHRIVWAEHIRCSREPRSGMPKICTMMSSTNVCKIPKAKGYGYKWPKLEELYSFLFKKGFDNAHDALADVEATAECFFELVKRGHITMPVPAPVQ